MIPGPCVAVLNEADRLIDWQQQAIEAVECHSVQKGQRLPES